MSRETPLDQFFKSRDVVACIFSYGAINVKNCNSYFFSMSRSLFFLQHCFLLFFPVMSTSLLSSCHVFFCYHQRDKWETREIQSLEAHVLTSSPLPLSPPRPTLSFSILHLSVFLSDSWQPVGYSGHANPSADICQLTWENTHLNVTDACMLQLCLSHCSSNTRSTHNPACWPQSFAVIKTHDWTFIRGLWMYPVGRDGDGGHTGSCRKINQRKHGYVERNWLEKSNRLWRDFKLRSSDIVKWFPMSPHYDDDVSVYASVMLLSWFILF